MIVMMMMTPGPVRAGRCLQQEILAQEWGRGGERQSRVLACAISGENQVQVYGVNLY